MRFIITCSVALLLAIDARGQGSLFPLRLVPMKGQFQGGGVVDMATGIFVDVDLDNDADVVGFASNALIVVPAVGATYPSIGVAYPSGSHPSVICAADVDGNGAKDAIIVSYFYATPSQLTTHLNDGLGGFAAPPLVRTLSTQFANMFVVNLNGDGIPDLALFDTSGQSVLLIGTGGGTYGPEMPLGVPPYGGSYADDDGDGDDDLHYITPGTFETKRNNGSGTFGPPIVHGAVYPTVGHPRFADMNGDGTLDAVFSGITQTGPYQTVSQIAFGNGAGGFVIGPSQILSTKTAQSSPILRDFDGDGDIDVSVWDPSGSAPAGLVLWSANDGSGNLAPPHEIDFRGVYYSVDAADVDGDGDCDFGIFFSGQLVLLESAGAAGLTSPGIVPIQGGPGSLIAGNLMRVADLDRDGRPDAITVYPCCPPTSISIVRDLSSPQAPQNIPIGYPIQDLALGDWSRDGILDLLVAVGPPISGLGLFIGNGSGGFGAPSFVPSGGNPIAIQPADVNGDGILDIVALHAQLSVIPGLGGGAFGPSITSTVCGANCPNDAFLVGDLNNDGFIDVVVSHPPVGMTNVPSTSIHLGNGSGTFALFGGNPNPIPTAVGAILDDLNHDGILDIARSAGDTYFTVQLGLGNGGFGPEAFTPTGIPNVTGPFGGDIAVGDLNGDGAPDIATAKGAVALNDGFGAFNSVAFHAFSQWQSRIAIADVDRDLQNDVIILQWGLKRILVAGNLTPTTGIGYSYGLGGPGAGGFVPRLSAFGLPQPGGTVTVRIDRALGGSAPAMILVSPTPALIPFGFGYTLFVDPATFQQIPVSLLGPPVAGAGYLDLTVVLPLAPGAFALAAQAVAFDPASPFSYSVSNGMFFTIQ